MTEKRDSAILRRVSFDDEQKTSTGLVSQRLPRLPVEVMHFTTCSIVYPTVIVPSTFTRKATAASGWVAGPWTTEAFVAGLNIALCAGQTSNWVLGSYLTLTP